MFRPPIPLACQEVRRCRRCRRGADAVPFPRNSLAGALCVTCRDADQAGRARRRLLREAARGAVRDGGARQPGACPAHLAWLRSLRCAVGQPGCGTTIHAHHVRWNTGGGTGLKPGDRWAVPLCPCHHSELHTGGAASFERRHSLDLRHLAVRLAAISPHLPKE